MVNEERKRKRQEKTVEEEEEKLKTEIAWREGRVWRDGKGKRKGKKNGGFFGLVFSESGWTKRGGKGESVFLGRRSLCRNLVYLFTVGV
jgi:phage gp29-like protein